jgi:membrane-associated PAP2 superfamily phosphatase
MQTKTWREIWITLVVLAAATALISLTGADLKVSSYFYQSGGWPIGELFPWKLLYRLDRYPALVVALFGLCAAIYGSYYPKWHHWRRQGIFLVLLLALGPGLIVNVVFKNHWGRPRPREITQFGGTKAFLQPWQPGINGQGRSFPCGHASAAFYLTAPFFIYRRKKTAVARRWLFGGTLFGLLMGYARIAQGAHFTSDVLWSAGMVYLVAMALAAPLLSHRNDVV